MISAALRGGGAGVVIRAPNHLGDLVMALPALEQAAGADVVVVRWLVPVLELAGLPGPIVPLQRGSAGFLRAARELRARRYRRGIVLPPSLSSALLFAIGGVPARRGTATDGRARLLHDAVPPADLVGLHRSAGYHLLVTGRAPEAPLVPRLTIPEELRGRWMELAGSPDAPLVGIFPGSNASSRRWDAQRFAELATRLARQGLRVVVFGAPSERALTAEVAGTAALDLGGRDDLPLLAAGLSMCELLVTNDSGPMHLAAAVGTPTVALVGPADPAVTGPLGGGHVVLRRADLPCVPCLRNTCPREGSGYILADAERECMRLIEVGEVEDAVRARGHPAFSED